MLIELVNVRLNVIETKCNFKNGVKEEDLMCPIWSDYQDTLIEHIGQCIKGTVK